MTRLSGLWQAVSMALAREGVPGTRAHGVYVPYAYADTLAPLTENASLGWLAGRMEREQQRYLDTVASASRFADRFAGWTHADAADRNRPRFDQLWFSGIDGAMAYAMVASLSPGRVLEVGSGHSTRFMARAIADEGLDTRLHSIDPVPRRDIDSLCHQVTRASVTALPASLFQALEADDVLFIDGSHAAVPGSDVEYLFTRVLPVLAPGVVVHVHDVFLPYGYPAAWGRRAYTEQSMLAALLSGGGRWQILCPAAWLRRHHGAQVDRLTAHLEPGALESSFWMQVTGSP